MHLAIWIITALLVGLWSLVAWVVGSLLGLAHANPGLPADWYEWLGRTPMAVWFDVWLPGWREAMVWAAQVFGTALGWLGDAGPVLVWVVWGFGTFALVAFAALLSGLVALARKASGGTGGPGATGTSAVRAPG